MWLLLFISLAAFNTFTLLSMLSSLTMICCGDFLFWSCLFGVLRVSCICVSFLHLEKFSPMILLRYFLCHWFRGWFFSLGYAYNLKGFFFFFMVLLISCVFLFLFFFFLHSLCTGLGLYLQLLMFCLGLIHYSCKTFR